MAIVDGFVSLGDRDVQVILGLEEDRMTMSSDGNEIGAWPTDEVAIDQVGEGVFTITAEDESLQFVPSDPNSFVIGFGGLIPRRPNLEQTGTLGTVEPESPAESASTTQSHGGLEVAPPPQPVTRVAFYALVAITGLFGLWALVSMIFG